MTTRLLLPSLFLFILLSFVPSPAHAATSDFLGPIVPPECNCENQPNPNGQTITTAPGLGCVLGVTQRIINFFISFACAVAALAFAYAGFLWILNPTNPEMRAQGRTMLLNIAIGLAIVLSAWLIVDFIMKKIYNENAATGITGDAKLGPWNSILSAGSPTACIAVTTAREISGLPGIVTAVTNGATGATRGSTGTTPGSTVSTTQGTGGAPYVSGTGGNCPAADPSTMVPVPASATSGDAEKATPTTVQNFMAMRAAALRDGIDLKVTDGYRSDAEQVILWDRYNHNTSQVAKPCSLGGNGSNHNSGTALDMTVGCAKTDRSCNSPQYRWLKTHGAQWNFRNALPTDTVHWSPTGR